jgi:ABC-type dipeptide/oligopeptide/nickel transport system permease component
MAWFAAISACPLPGEARSPRKSSDDCQRPSTRCFRHVFATLTGLIVGILSAVHPRSLLDHGTYVGVFVFLCYALLRLDSELTIFFRGIWSGSRRQGAAAFTPSMIGHRLPQSPSTTLFAGFRSSMLQVLNMDTSAPRAKGLDSPRTSNASRTR